MKAFFNIALGLGVAAGCATVARAGETRIATDYAAPVTVTRLFQKTVDEAGRPLAYPKPGDGRPEVTALAVEIAPGGETGWHKHPLTCLAYVIDGELEVTLADGRVNTIKAGEALCEVVDLEHNGVNHGAKPAKLVMFVLGTEGGGPFTVKTAPPAASSPVKDGDAKK